MNKIFIVIACSLLLSGCAQMMGFDKAPTQQEIATADYGPMPENYQDIVREIITSSLKDPESARFEFSKPPYRAYNTETPLTYGWKVCGYYNAKNSYGGYVGKQQFYFLINNGRIVRSSFGTGYGTAYAEDACQRGL